MASRVDNRAHLSHRAGQRAESRQLRQLRRTPPVGWQKKGV